MKLYYAPQTRSTRATWMLGECGADYDLEIINVRAGGGSAPEFRKISPMGKTPVLVDDGAVMADSVALCLYLADKFPEAKLAPPIGDPRRGAYYHWMVFHGSSLEPAFIQKAVKWESDQTGMIGWGSPERVFDTLKAAIPADGYLLGDEFSAADLLIGGTLAFLKPSGLFELWPDAEAYIERCTTRPAAVKAQELDARLAAELEA